MRARAQVGRVLICERRHKGKSAREMSAIGSVEAWREQWRRDPAKGIRRMLAGEDRIECLTWRADERDAFFLIYKAFFFFCDERGEGNKRRNQAVGADLYYSIAPWRFSYWTSTSGKKRARR